MSQNNLSCGEALVSLLEKYGVTDVFGIPGNHTLELYRGLEHSPIRHVLARHEQGAGFMADGYARSTGKPGVCFLITGPGLLNAATAMGQAYSDSQPMLVISAVNPTKLLGKQWGDVHELPNQKAITAGYTAFSATALSAGEVPGLIARAFSVFNSARPRPVHIEIPMDIFFERVTEEWLPFPMPAAPAPSEASIEQAVSLLSSAKNPAMIIGGGAMDAGSALVEIADKLNCPVLMTVTGNGAIPDSHPLCLGPRSNAPLVFELFANADVVLVIGSELSINEGVNPENPMTMGQKLIRIDIDPDELVHRIPSDVSIWADASVAARAMADALPQSNADRDSVASQVKKLRLQSDAALTDLQKKHIRVVDIIQDVMPEDTMFSMDMSQIAYTTRATMGFEIPRRVMQPKGFGTLGFGLPVAIGAKIANPDTPVVAIAGDSGVIYTIQEMLTAADDKANVILIVWNNSALAEIRDGFTKLGVKPIGIAPLTPDFQAVASAFGWKSVRASTPDLLREALIAAQAADYDSPLLIEINEADDY